jgi:hypothetical protein
LDEPSVSFVAERFLRCVLLARLFATGGINTYTYDYAFCSRTVLLRVTFKL